MSYLQDQKPVTLFELGRMRAEGRKIAMLTAYDASFAALLGRAGVDSILIGDSLGNVLQGQKSTLPVTLEQMAYHTECVARAGARPFVVTDMPFGSYHESREQAMRNAARLMAAGAQMVKLEGGEFMAETVRFLVERGVPVCAHIGLTPQSVHALGGYRVQGRDEEGARRMVRDAVSLEQAGAAMMVLVGLQAAQAQEAQTNEQEKKCRVTLLQRLVIGAGKEEIGVEQSGKPANLHAGMFMDAQYFFVNAP